MRCRSSSLQSESQNVLSMVYIVAGFSLPLPLWSHGYISHDFCHHHLPIDPPHPHGTPGTMCLLVIPWVYQASGTLPSLFAQIATRLTAPTPGNLSSRGTSSVEPTLTSVFRISNSVPLSFHTDPANPALSFSQHLSHSALTGWHGIEWKIKARTSSNCWCNQISIFYPMDRLLWNFPQRPLC